ncbi:DUF3349 domain-containing protein [Corynebacterium aquilae]|uniref:DUF3349 domain-containing protein n=1 Tax=Corynebacterium aquilae DSM 44791 TaxID=1431546 RepID=A0A1L7CDP4_9CORY|nr:DUF3349 domain-containing protein [Corynebacterium aquilae]APT83965.1 hypothetical protein CAQU_01510 [Corynebacterium aquilae DSM 44791]
MSDKNVIARFLDWLREGYPQGVPEADACAITYVLKRHLNDEDLRAISKAIIEDRGLSQAAEASDEEIREFIEKFEMQTPEEADIERIHAILAEKFSAPDAD